MKKTMINNNEVEVVIHEQETAGGNQLTGIGEYVVQKLKDLQSMSIVDVGQSSKELFSQINQHGFLN